MKDERPIARAYPAKNKTNFWPWLIALGVIVAGVSIFSVAGFVMVRAQKAAKERQAAEPEVRPFTTDAELIAWKDGEAKDFVGKTFRVKATYEDHKPLRASRSGAKFRRFADTWGKDVRVDFVVDIPEGIELANVTYGEDVIIEFVSTNGLLGKGNKVTSLSRKP